MIHFTYLVTGLAMPTLRRYALNCTVCVRVCVCVCVCVYVCVCVCVCVCIFILHVQYYTNQITYSIHVVHAAYKVSFDACPLTD